jgi:hypothetical protein
MKMDLFFFADVKIASGFQKLKMQIFRIEMIDLTNTELFFDLHNDYDCTAINYKLPDKTINFLFLPRIHDPAKKELCLLFEEATIADFNVN